MLPRPMPSPCPPPPSPVPLRPRPPAPNESPIVSPHVLPRAEAAAAGGAGSSALAARGAVAEAVLALLPDESSRPHGAVGAFGAPPAGVFSRPIMPNSEASRSALFCSSWVASSFFPSEGPMTPKRAPEGFEGFPIEPSSPFARVPVPPSLLSASADGASDRAPKLSPREERDQGRQSRLRSIASSRAAASASSESAFVCAASRAVGT